MSRLENRSKRAHEKICSLADRLLYPRGFLPIGRKSLLFYPCDARQSDILENDRFREAHHTRNPGPKDEQTKVLKLQTTDQVPEAATPVAWPGHSDITSTNVI
jgi:hypothetical protein